MSYNNLTRKALARLFVPLALAWLPASGYAAGVGASAPPSFNGPNYEAAADNPETPTVTLSQPTADPESGTALTFGNQITIFCSSEDINAGATLSYNVNGSGFQDLSDPQQTFTIGENINPENGSITIEAKAVILNSETGAIEAESEVATFTYPVFVEAPSVSLIGGIDGKVQSGSQILLECPTQNVIIEYSINKNDSWSDLVSSPFHIDITDDMISQSHGEFYIQAWATRDGINSSSMDPATYYVYVEQPQVRLDNGVWDEKDNLMKVIPGSEVYLECTTPGAYIFYRVNNRGNLADVQPFYERGSITITESMISSAINGEVIIEAVATLGNQMSEIESFTYAVVKVPHPTPSIPSKSAVQPGTLVTLTCENGDNIYYELSNLGVGSKNEWQGPFINEVSIPIEKDVCLWNKAVRNVNGYDIISSDGIGYWYKTILPPYSIPENGSTVSPDEVYLQCDTNESQIWYSNTNAPSDEASAWTLYDRTTPIDLTQFEVIDNQVTFWAHTTIPEWQGGSDPVQFTYYIEEPQQEQVATPIAFINGEQTWGGSVPYDTSVELYCDTPGAQIVYFVTNGYGEWLGEGMYEGPIQLSQYAHDTREVRIEFYATCDGYRDSETNGYTFTLEEQQPQEQVATPVALINGYETTGGDVPNYIFLELNCTTQNAQIWYEITNSQGEWGGPYRYENLIYLNEYANENRQVEIKFWATCDGYKNSETQTYTFTVEEQSEPQVSKPLVFIYGGDKAEDGQTLPYNVSIYFWCNPQESKMHYDINGITGETFIGNPLPLKNYVTGDNRQIEIKIWASHEDYKDSETNYYTFTLEEPQQEQVAMPIAFINGEQTWGGSVPYYTSVELYCDTPNAQIVYFLTNGYGEWLGEGMYEGPIQLSQYANDTREVRIEFYATLDGTDSEPNGYTFTLEEPQQQEKVSTPIAYMGENGQELSNDASVPYDTSIYFNCYPEAATIHYDINGITGYTYNGYSLPLNQYVENGNRQVYIQVWASCDGYQNSDTNTYTITLEEQAPSLPTPRVYINSKEMSSGDIPYDAVATFSCELQKATIHYNINGTYGDYTEPIQLSQFVHDAKRQVEVEVWASYEGYKSETQRGSFTVGEQPSVEAPVASIESEQSIAPGTVIYLTCATEGTEIWYYLNNDESTSYKYETPITISGDYPKVDIKPYATLDGYKNGEGSWYRYTIDQDALTPPTSSGESAPGDVEPGTEVELTTTDDANILYRLDNPNASQANAPLKVAEEDSENLSPLPGWELYKPGVTKIIVDENMSIWTCTYSEGQEGDEPKQSAIVQLNYSLKQVSTPIAKIEDVPVWKSQMVDGYIDWVNVAVAYDASVSLSCATDGATIHYEVNGTPGKMSNNSSIALNKFVTADNRQVDVEVWAICDGYEMSKKNYYRFIVEEDHSVAAPTASIPSGTAVVSGTAVELFCEESAVIWYTLDGTSPYGNAEAKVYTEPIVINEATTICAAAILNGYYSEVAEFTYTMWIPTQDQASKPTASIPSGTAVEAGTEVELSCETPGAQIWYTLDGSNPRNSETRVLYENPIVIDKTMTIRSVATIDGYYDSMVAEFRYRVKEPAAKPEASLPQESEVDAGTSVELTSESEGAEIWYTLDGTSPITSETRIRYEQGIVIYEETTILAVAIGEDYLNSEVAEYHYTVKVPSGIYGVTGDKLTVATLPGGNGFQVAGVNGRSVVVYVFDTTGKAAMPNREISEDTVIPMDNCAPGVYVVKAVAADEVATLKLNLR